MPTSADRQQDPLPDGPRIRRHPTGPIPQSREDDTRTHIIRRAPVTTGDDGRPHTAIASAAAGMLSGWATAAVATDLIGSRWPQDRVFCLAIGFLAILFAASSLPGVVLLLMRRGIGRYLIAFSCAVAVLTFGALFVAATTLAWPVYLIPLLPLSAVGLALAPATGKWCRLG